MDIGSVTVRQSMSSVSQRQPVRTVTVTDQQNTLRGLLDVDLTGIQNNDVLIYDSVSNKILPRNPEDAVRETLVRTLNFIIDGGGSLVTPGSKGNVYIDFSANISGWSIINDVSGNVSINVSKSSYNTFGTFIESGGTVPKTISNLKAISTNVDWTGFNSISENDILQFIVTGTTENVTKTTLSLKLTQTL